MQQAKGITIGYWIATSLFALQMGFTAYAQLRLPQVAAAFTHLGFPAYFRVELSWLKLAGILVLLLPAPARLKEWAYAGFAITLVSALIAHLSVGMTHPSGAGPWAPPCSGPCRTTSSGSWRLGKAALRWSRARPPEVFGR